MRFFWGKFTYYLTRLFIVYFISGLFIFVGLFLVSDFLGDSSRFDQVSNLLIFQFYFYMLPEIIYRMLPVAGLVGTIFTLGQIQRTNELIGLLSLGISLRQIILIIISWHLVITALMIYISDSWLPEFTLKKNQIYFNEFKKQSGLYTVLKTGKIWYKIHDHFLYIRSLDPVKKEAQNLILYSVNLHKWKIYQVIEAVRARIQGENWELFDGVITVFSEEKAFPVTQKFDRKIIVMNQEIESLMEVTKPSDILNFKELREFIFKNKAAGVNTLRYEVDFWSKIVFSFAGIVMSLLAIPFVIKKERSGEIMGSIAVVLGLVFFYWILYSSGLNLGYYGKTHPILAALGPSIFILFLATYLIYRKKI